MAKGLRDSWKDTGVGLGHAFRDLGKTLIKTGSDVAKKADKWANGDEDEQKEGQKPETPEEEK